MDLEPDGAGLSYRHDGQSKEYLVIVGSTAKNM